MIRYSALVNRLSLALVCTTLLGTNAYSADADCESLPDSEGDVLVALHASYSEALLRINFDADEVCVVSRGDVEVDAQNGAALHVNSELDEMAVQATVEGFETWLRLDSEYEEELKVDRRTAEGLDLTAAEFLGDNSQLESSDFFIEYVGSLEIGDFQLRNVETKIPLLDSPYDHYEGRSEIPSADYEFLTVGSIGEEILEDLIIVLDSANNRIYLSEAD